jgi:hypothetical protein
MIEYLGVAYEVAKNLKDYLKWDEEDKLVDLAWLEKSGFGAEARRKGYELRWVRPDKVESLIRGEGHRLAPL